MFWPSLLLLLIAVLERSTCGQICSNRIIGGSSVDIKSRPYQANIVVDGSPICSGAIIGERVILTAAQCVYGWYTSSVRVRVGSSARESGGTLARVCGITTHPQYSEWRYDNNLAVLELCDPLTFSDSVKDIMVADKLPEEAEVAGWGSTSWWGSWWDRCFFGSRPNTLQVTSVSVYASWKQCASEVESLFDLWTSGISDRTICTHNFDRSACSYDIGAPLVKDGKLLGILSYAGCTTYPDVFGNVLRFRTWLAAVTPTEMNTTIDTTLATTTVRSNKTLATTTVGSNTTLATTTVRSNKTLATTTEGSTTTTPTTTTKPTEITESPSSEAL